MKWLVIEIQTMANGTVANLVTAHDTEKLAESKWHTVMAAAAVSGLPVHSATLLDNFGNVVLSGSYSTEQIL